MVVGMAWAWVVERVGTQPTTLFLLSWLYSVSLYWVIGLLHLVDLGKRLRHMKIQPDATLAASGGKHNPPLWPVLMRVLSTQVSILLPGVVLMARAGRIRFDADPSPLHVVVLQLVVCAVVEEVGFFYAHRLLHVPALYRRIHKRHHEFKSPIALAAQYAHPLEVVVGNALPVAAGPLLVGMHWTTWIIWLTLVIVGTMAHHCGYDYHLLRWDHNPQFHDDHHRHFNCNYGLTGWLDRLHGSYRPHTPLH